MFVDARTGLLHHRGEYMGPAWIRGFYEQGLKSGSSRDLSVTVENIRESGLDFSMRVSW